MLYDNYFYGSKFYSSIVPVNSTHGSLNNINMTSFIMSTGRTFEGPLGIEEAKKALEEMTGQPIEKNSSGKE
jgi:hypothetical protein